jgi:hypothetical protein
LKTSVKKCNGLAEAFRKKKKKRKNYSESNHFEQIKNVQSVKFTTRILNQYNEIINQKQPIIICISLLNLKNELKK